MPSLFCQKICLYIILYFFIFGLNKTEYMEDIIDTIEQASGHNWQTITNTRVEEMMAWKCIFVEESVELLKSMGAPLFLKSMEGVGSLKISVGGNAPKTPIGSDSPKIADGGTTPKSVQGVTGPKRVISKCFTLIASNMGAKRGSIYYYLEYKKGITYKDCRAKYDLVKHYFD